MNKELMEALDILEKEKNISKDTLLGAIEQSLIQACKNHFGKADNVHVTINPETCDFSVYAEREVKEFVEDPALEISLVEAQKLNTNAELGDIIKVEIHSKEFGRIATQNAKNVILQKIREEERKVLYDQYYGMEKEVVTGIVQRVMGKNVSVNLGKADGVLSENEQVKGEEFKPTERIKVYILEVKDTPKGPRILLSRTHPGLVKRLFESEVAEVKDGTVEIKSIAREAGSRTKIAVWSNDPDVDPVGACVGPAKVIAVMADPDEKTALVVVPDYQLSLAIGKEGQNARLAARLTGFKIDIKSETQARESGELYDYDDEDEYYDEDEYSEEDTEETAEDTEAEEAMDAEEEVQQSVEVADEVLEKVEEPLESVSNEAAQNEEETPEPAEKTYDELEDERLFSSIGLSMGSSANVHPHDEDYDLRCKSHPSAYKNIQHMAGDKIVSVSAQIGNVLEDISDGVSHVASRLGLYKKRHDLKKEQKLLKKEKEKRLKR